MVPEYAEATLTRLRTTNWPTPPPCSTSIGIEMLPSRPGDTHAQSRRAVANPRTAAVPRLAITRSPALPAPSPPSICPNRPWLEWIERHGGPDRAGARHRAHGRGGRAAHQQSGHSGTDGRQRPPHLQYPLSRHLEHGRTARRQPGRARKRRAGHWPKSHDQPPLYVPLDKEPVATLLRVYRENTGDTESQPGTMGGGTYARATPAYRRVRRGLSTIARTAPPTNSTSASPCRPFSTPPKSMLRLSTNSPGN